MNIKITLSVLIVLGFSSKVTAQWVQSGNNVLLNSGSVGIGTQNPAAKLSIDGNSGSFVGADIVIKRSGSLQGVGQSPTIQLEDTESGRGSIIQSFRGQLQFFNSSGNGWRECMRLIENGNVGIGTSTPSAKLEVGGNDNTYMGADISITRSSSSPGEGRSPALQFNDLSTGDASIIQSYHGTLQFLNSSSGSGWREHMRITGDGNVGIGMTAPDARLSVNGTIHTKEVKVDMNGWPDYVFDKSYLLPSLQEVDLYIAKHRHLPDVPSEKEVLDNGINLGEMNRLLLKKIEELTLYLIRKDSMDKEKEVLIKTQQEQIEELKGQMEGILKKVDSLSR
ncbi:hypothetical protein [Pararcticibacter amylolyticus]|uniref:Cell wall anchor protein n=1 Tax=Pararcticibacter amylolyticus TaxID=2173175 RepID=A0A2U2P985_9SPHI|nr:hypothetical protein [Pararcticibacter amylolyticus]PWG77942.1 hypothetical protein DDR33_24845 [Pararcticibacter amylolyticus]